MKNKSKLQAVILAGEMLSNIAFNLKQNKEVRDEWRKSMEEAQTAWDFALNDYRRRGPWIQAKLRLKPPEKVFPHHYIG